jgi:N-carbamoyl-L-amino-acid hydrolase
MVGSGVFAGVFDLAEGLARPDNVTGVTLGAELARIGFAGPEPVGGRPVAAYFEAHIEQGPILEAAGLPVGSSPAPRGNAGTRSPSPVRRRMPGRRQCCGGAPRWSVWRG